MTAVREVRIGDAVLYCGDCRDVLPALSGVDAVVTSPPYWHQRDYGAPIEDWTALVSSLACVSDAAQILVNLGLIYRDGELVEYWDGFKAAMRAAGWRLFGWYVWDKGFGIPRGDQINRPSGAHEWIFHFNKSARPINKWVRSLDRVIPGNGVRQPNGSFNGVTSPHTVGQPFKAPDSVLRFAPHQHRGGPENGHPAIFPVALPNHLIRSFSDPGDMICDPFMGSGTTAISCVRLGRRFVGIEIEPAYFDIAYHRIEAEYRQLDLFHGDHAPAPARAVQPDMLAAPDHRGPA